MKIKSDLHAGQTFAQCDDVRNWWKEQARRMAQWASNPTYPPPSNLYVPGYGGPQPPTYPPATSGGGSTGGSTGGGTYYPPQTVGSVQPIGCGAYINGVYYPDQSGACI